ncbi:M48 family metallopeptidase [Sedimentibacter sp. B4]|uniref:M48 family metallopeptidase n=1 Tax=Sedimentibacter sp. B4 TaxID=304766 RepID=UPI0002E67585|nr:SprT family zinc-dependent metalloprotease [Sedimentibacter sp. B4]
MNKITLENIEIEVVKKNIKNLNLSVNPPYGDVRLSVPKKMNDEAVKCFALSKLDWIKKQREKFKVQEKFNIEYKSGELHCLFGKKYELKVVENNVRQFAELNGEHIILHVRKDSSFEKKEKIIQEFYREKLKSVVPEYIEKWENIIGVNIESWAVKIMKTRWGTCNTRNRKIWINLELAKKSKDCLEYIIVHELTHLLERYHNKIFYNYMDEFLPHWKNIKMELNGMS